MKNKSRLFNSLFGLALTLLLFTTTIFAWITLSSQVRVEEIVVAVGTHDAEIVFEVNKNGSQFEEIITQEEMLVFFNKAIPGDKFGFKLHIENKSDAAITLDIDVLNLVSSEVDEEINLLDVFHLAAGKFIAHTIFEGGERVLYPTEAVDVISTEEVGLGDHIFNLYRFSNIIDDNNNLKVGYFNLGHKMTLEIEFYIVFDEAVFDVRYQEEIFSFDTIVVNFK